MVQQNLEVVKTRFAYTFLELAQGIFTKEYPRWEQRPTKETQGEKERADLVALWLNTAYWEILKQGGQDSWLLQVQDILRYGRGVQKIHRAPHLWVDEPQANGGDLKEWKEGHDDWLVGAPIPISARHVHPRAFHSFPDSYGMQHGIEVQRRQVRDIKASYDEEVWSGSRLNKMKAAENVYWFEHQNRAWCTYGVIYSGGGQKDTWDPRVPRSGITILRQWEHGYGEPSFVEIDGDRQTSMELAEQRLSILWPMMPLIIQLDRWLSQYATNAKFTGWPYLGYWQGENTPRSPNPTGRPPDIELKPFTLQAFFQGEEVKPIPMPQFAPDAIRFGEMLMTLIEQAGLLPILSGNVADYAAGYAINQRTHAARSRYNPIAQRMTAGFEKIGSLLLRCVELIDAKVYVETSEGYLPLEPKDVQHKRLIGKLPLSLPTDKQLMLRLGREAMAEPRVMSRYTVQNDLLEMEDPGREDRFIAQERVDEQVIPQISALVMEGVTMALTELKSPNRPPENGAVGQPPGAPVIPGVGQPITPTNQPAAARPPGGPNAGIATQPNTPAILIPGA